MIDEPFLEDGCAALPIYVAAAAGEETRHGVATEMVDPTLQAELAHQRVNPGEAGKAESPALEIRFVDGGVDGVGAGREAALGVVGRGEMPGDKARTGIVERLPEVMGERRLGPEVHVSEEELADEVRRDRGRTGMGF